MALLLRVVVIGVVGCATASDPRFQPAIDASGGGGGDPTQDAGVDAPPADAPPATSACAMALAQRGTDFEAGATGWTHVVLDGAAGQANWPFDDWEFGTATSGPNSCHGGTKCWATKLGANYTSCQRAALVSPPIDLSACSGANVTLEVYSWHDFWTGTVSGTQYFDGGIIEVSNNGTAWSQITPMPAYPGTTKINPFISFNECVLSNSFHVHGKPGFVGAGPGWQKISIKLPASVVTSTFRVRFAYSSGVSFANSDPEVDRLHTRPGWYVDDLTFAEK
jgi:hypothetical protein